MKPIHRNVLPDLLLITALIFGAFVRFNPTMLNGFVIKQGGMFAVMIDDLRENQYLIPRYTTYNHLDIPYAYPPLGFYLGGIAADLFGLGATEVLRWLPAFFATLSILAFYLLAMRVMKDKYRAAVATLFFALMPRAFSWFVTGGGLTRSPAQFFMLLTLAGVVRLYEEKRRGDILWAGIFGGLTVLSHPEAALHTIVIAVFLWIMLSRSFSGFLRSVGVAVVTLLVTAPWWVTVISYHGIEPLLNAAQTGQKASAVLQLLFFTFTEEPYATFIVVFGLMGLTYSLIRRDYLLPLWIAIPFLAEGRSAAGPAAIPLAMLAATGFVDIVLPPLLSLARRGREQLEDMVPALELGIISYLLLYLVFSAYQYGLQLSSVSLYTPEREAMHWISRNTPEEARFLVLTGTTSLSCDSVLEWFPALTDRHSLYTVQGTEWTKGANFIEYVTSTYSVQRCLGAGDMICLDTAIDRSTYDYLYVSKLMRVNNCSTLNLPGTFPYFMESIRADGSFNAIYETDDVAIFERR